MSLSLLTLANEYLRPAIPTASLVVATIPHYVVAIIANGILKLCRAKPQTIDTFHSNLWGFYQRYVLFIFETISSQEIICYGDLPALTNANKAIYISNHQSSVDWVVVDMIAARSSNDCGRIRYVLKHSLALVPLYGIYFYIHGCVYVKRGKSYFNQTRAVEELHYLKQIGQPYWLVLFPEGTRMKHTQAQRDLNNKWCPPDLECPQHVLLPKVVGFRLAFDTLRESIDSVIDVTVAYSQGPPPPSMFSFVCNAYPSQCHLYIRKIDPASIPIDQEEQAKWLHSLFIEKDRLMAHFFANGRFPGALVKENANAPLSSSLVPALVYGLVMSPLLFYPMARKIYFGVWLSGWLLDSLYMKFVAKVL